MAGRNPRQPHQLLGRKPLRRVIHRYHAIGAHPTDARLKGTTAIAVNQTLSFGVITGACLHWRMLLDQTLWQPTKITPLIALFFLSAWAVITATTLAALPLAPFKLLALAWAEFARKVHFATPPHLPLINIMRNMKLPLPCSHGTGGDQTPP